MHLHESGYTGWIGASGLLSIPLYLLYVFQDNCSDSYSTASSPSVCLNLRDYGILSGDDFQVCETVIEVFGFEVNVLHAVGNLSISNSSSSPTVPIQAIDFPFLRFSKTTLQNLSTLCEESTTLYPAYLCAYLGCVIVVCSLIHFLVCITANYAHIKKDRLLTESDGGGAGGGDGSLHGEVTTGEQKNAEENNAVVKSPDTIGRLRDDVINVFKTDLSDLDMEKDSVGAYVPSGRIQNDLVNYWLQ